MSSTSLLIALKQGGAGNFDNGASVTARHKGQSTVFVIKRRLCGGVPIPENAVCHRCERGVDAAEARNTAASRSGKCMMRSCKAAMANGIGPGVSGGGAKGDKKRLKVGDKVRVRIGGRAGLGAPLVWESADVVALDDTGFAKCHIDGTKKDEDVWVLWADDARVRRRSMRELELEAQLGR